MKLAQQLTWLSVNDVCLHSHIACDIDGTIVRNFSFLHGICTCMCLKGGSRISVKGRLRSEELKLGTFARTYTGNIFLTLIIDIDLLYIYALMYFGIP